MNENCDKRRLRKEAAAVRARAAAAAPDAAAALVESFRKSALAAGLDFERGAGRAVAGYWPMRSEIDPRPLMRHMGTLGASLLLPVVTRKDRPLIFRHWHEGDALGSDAMGLAVPGPEREEGRPTLLIVPLLAVDERGYRLGYGAGHYDRTLSKLRADAPVLAVGVAYEAQRVACLPAEPHDVPLDWLLTEAGAYDFSRDGSRHE